MNFVNVVVTVKYDDETDTRSYSYEWQGAIWRPATISRMLMLENPDLRAQLPWRVVFGRYSMYSDSYMMYRVAGLTWMVMIPFEYLTPLAWRSKANVIRWLHQKGLADWYPYCIASWRWIHWPWNRKGKA